MRYYPIREIWLIYYQGITGKSRAVAFGEWILLKIDNFYLRIVEAQ